MHRHVGLAQSHLQLVHQENHNPGLQPVACVVIKFLPACVPCHKLQDLLSATIPGARHPDRIPFKLYSSATVSGIATLRGHAIRECVCNSTLMYHRLDAPPSLRPSDGLAWCAGHSSDRDRLARAAPVGTSRSSGSGVLLAWWKLLLRDALLVVICDGHLLSLSDSSPGRLHHTLSAHYCKLVMRSIQYAPTSS